MRRVLSPNYARRIAKTPRLPGTGTEVTEEFGNTRAESPKHPDDGPGVRCASSISCLKLSLMASHHIVSD